MARIYILGRNAPENEPWPDVIGFAIIFIVSVMFMLGLEVNVVNSLVSFFALTFNFPSIEFQSIFVHIGVELIRYNCHFDRDNIDSRQFNIMAVEKVVSKRIRRRKCNYYT